ncbi:MAG: endonuclease/exonuclease/phosphatase family protein [Methylococcaceae bacterium]|nr:endonuclease/exonuclease/phosphatase family protein [Methylococcaceae bacterium]
MTEIIQLLTVENTLSRKTNGTQQLLVFLIRVANVGYDKQVEVIWSGEDGVWQTLPASYLYSRGDGQECWRARMTVHSQTGRPQPKAIRFALRLRYAGSEYWDNNDSNNYTSLAGSGIELAKAITLQNLGFTTQMDESQQWLNIKVAVNPQFSADSVEVHWTTDNWLHCRQASCRQNSQSRREGAQIWTTRLKVGDAFRLQYAIVCQNRHQQIWDNNGGCNYVASRKPLKVMILNLHCYQEDHQDRKFSQIAKAIDELAVDIVCFQEVAEHWNHGNGDWDSNSANIINLRLKQPFQLYSDWSHIGFDKYREGVALLSRYPMIHRQSRYVSDSHDVHSIHSRKVVMAQIDVPYIGIINVFSAHLSWWEDGFQLQFQRLSEWADNQSGKAMTNTLLCGDFNITAGTAGYRQVVEANQYEDQYLAANAQGLFEKIFRVDDPHWQHYPSDDYRIDYIFMNKDSQLRVTSARALFTDQDYGRVSDHCGYLMTFEPK